MRGAECWTDHQLILFKIKLNIRPSCRLSGIRQRRISCDRLKSEETLEAYVARTDEMLTETAGLNRTVSAQ